MATINTYTAMNDHNKSFNRYRTEQVSKADDFLLQGFRSDPADVCIGVKFYGPGGGPVVPSAGTVLVEVAPTVIHPAFVAVGSIVAATPIVLEWSGNLQDIRITPTGLLGFATWRVVITQNWK